MYQRNQILRVTHARSAFTLLELVVVTGLMAGLVAILLPAVQSVREAARQVHCKNNLHQIGLAFHQYHADFRSFPPRRYKFQHSWAIYVLPYIEQQNVRELYDMNAIWYAQRNQEAVQTVVPTFQCPTSRLSGTAHTTIRYERKAATNDYAPPSWVSVELVTAGFIRNRASFLGMLWGGEATGFRDAMDGTSNTMLLAEDTTRPLYFRADRRLGPQYSPSTGGNMGVEDGVVRGAAWADPANGIPMNGFTVDGATSPGPCPVNCTNNNEMYSFHPGGVHCLMTDGAVRFLSESVDIDTAASLITASASDAATPGEFLR